MYLMCSTEYISEEFTATAAADAEDGCNSLNLGFKAESWFQANAKNRNLRDGILGGMQKGHFPDGVKGISTGTVSGPLKSWFQPQIGGATVSTQLPNPPEQASPF